MEQSDSSNGVVEDGEKDEEEDLGGVDARRVVVRCPGIRPHEKYDLREELQDMPVHEGLELADEIEGFGGEVLKTDPTAGDGFGQSQVVVTRKTDIQIESDIGGES